MATRAYRRDSHGRFAGSGGGTKITYGKAGGFANAAFRSRVMASRANARPAPSGGQKAKSNRSLAKTIRNVDRVTSSTGTMRAARAVTRGALTVGVANVASRAIVKGITGQSTAGQRMGTLSTAVLFASGASASIAHTSSTRRAVVSRARPPRSTGRKIRR